MSVAAIEAERLRDQLGSLSSLQQCATPEFAIAFQKAVSAVVSVPWSLVVTEDLRFPETRGSRNATTRFLQWYTKPIYRLSGSDQLSLKSFLEVASFKKQPDALFRPDILRRIFKDRLRNRIRGEPHPRELR